MVDNLGYTIHTHDIPIGVFLDMIKGDIKKLFQTYGHKNCGLMHEELCEKIKKIITSNKTLILSYTNEHGQQKLISEWKSQKKEFFNKLFEKEGFINMCEPPHENGNKNLQKLKLKHIKFCKKRDDWKAAVEANPEYNACREYNSWIETEKASFTREYLVNVRKFKSQTVDKYFSTKDHPGGHDPRGTYHNSKLNCNKYNPSLRSQPQGPIAREPPNSLRPPRAPGVIQESQKKSGKFVSDEKGKIEITKPDVKQPTKNEPHASNSQTSSLTNTNVDGTANGQHDDLEAKGTGLPTKDQGATVQPTEATDAIAQSPEQLPEPPSLIFPKDSPAAKVPYTPPSVVKDQDTDPNVTPSTTSGTSGTTHSIQNVPSHSVPDLSLAQPQSPAVAEVTDKNSKEPTIPDAVIKSKDNGGSLTSPLNPPSSLDPGLVSAPVAASNSSASATLSTTLSTTSTSTAGSSPVQNLLLITATPQSTATTPISTTTILPENTTATLDPSTTTFSAIDTKPKPSVTEITSTTDERGKPKAPFKTLSYSQDSNFVPTKEQDDTIPPINFPSPDANANLNMIQHPSQPLGTPPDQTLGSSPGLPSVLSAMSPEGSPGVSPSLHAVAIKPGKCLNYNIFIQ
ncbi:hypothetical protein POVWA2_079790 [Plasmodium ovale wallikeri]|uniref:STP1 protein n=1 Tax=Plasmodium ovale wallikeri TaxID=864142 RepID=A0A1A9AMN1_PLAOA|nr:hypothetical protein POVWA2_079790 [Plasmodium ovale wallikeri]